MFFVLFWATRMHAKLRELWSPICADLNCAETEPSKWNWKNSTSEQNRRNQNEEKNENFSHFFPISIAHVIFLFFVSTFCCCSDGSEALATQPRAMAISGEKVIKNNLSFVLRGGHFLFLFTSLSSRRCSFCCCCCWCRRNSFSSFFSLSPFALVCVAVVKEHLFGNIVSLFNSFSINSTAQGTICFVISILLLRRTKSFSCKQ